MNKFNNAKTGIVAFALTVASLAMPLLAHAQAVTIDPTQQANLNAAMGSIPTTATGEIFAMLPVVLPYVLIMVALGIAFFVVRFLMHQGRGH